LANKRGLFCAWLLKEHFFRFRDDYLTAKPRTFLISICGWKPLVVCGRWWVEGVLESKRLERKLLQSGLMREERRPATGRNVGDFREKKQLFYCN